MAILPISAGSGYYNAKSAGVSPEQRLADLKKQRNEAEEEMKLGKSPELENKISTLDRQIKNISARLNKVTGKEECQTCKNRKYKDESDDPGVSFKTAAKISPGNASSTVLRHEYEHVNRNRAKAEREGTEIVSQTVTLKTAICPECGNSYISGGETKTVTKKSIADRFNVGIPDETKKKGRFINYAA